MWKTIGSAFAFSLPQCPFRVFTGFLCPGCGGTRALEALSQGRVAEALRQNLLVVGVLFSVAGWSLWLFFRSFRKAYRPPAWWAPAWLGWVFGVAVALFWVLRNVFWLLVK